MSDIGKTALKNKIDAKIYDNESQLITGTILNEVLQDAVDTLADGGNLDAGSVDTANLNDEAVTKGKLAQNVSTDLDWAVASNSYYRNSQAGNVAAKVITTYKNMNLIGGGSLKVTFEQANTADDATLNIDGKGAKPLYYNGARVSSTNSWEAGETVEIYYNNYNSGAYYAKRWMVEPVSVSQNTITGHTDINVGNRTTPLPSVAEVEALKEEISDLSLGKFYGFFEDDSDLPTGDLDGYAYVGASMPFAIYVFKDGEWSDSGTTYAPPVGNGDDIDTNSSNQLQFADRAYNSETPDGMGYVILRKNIVNGVNILTQLMMIQTNTIYVIRYDFTLNENITVPANCVLEFDGGSINGAYTITSTNTRIDAGLVKIFDTNVTLIGDWNVSEAYPEWFGAKGDGITDDVDAIQKCLNSFECTKFNNKTYALYNINSNRVHLTLPAGKSIIGKQYGHTISSTNFTLKSINDDALVTLLLDGRVTVNNISIYMHKSNSALRDNYTSCIKSEKANLTLHTVCAYGGDIGYNLKTFLTTIIHCDAYHNNIGFYIHGKLDNYNDENVITVYTSVTMIGCYAILSRQQGYRIVGMTYSTFINLAADNCGQDVNTVVNSHTDVSYPYEVRSSFGCNLINCGCEESLKYFRVHNSGNITFENGSFVYGIHTQEMAGGAYTPARLISISYCGSSININSLYITYGGVDPSGLKNLVNDDSPLFYFVGNATDEIICRFKYIPGYKKSNIALAEYVGEKNYTYEDGVKEASTYVFNTGSLMSNLSTINFDNTYIEETIIVEKNNNAEFGNYFDKTLDLKGHTLHIKSLLTNNLTAYGQAGRLNFKNGKVIFDNVYISNIGTGTTLSNGIFKLVNCDIEFRKCVLSGSNTAITFINAAGFESLVLYDTYINNNWTYIENSNYYLQYSQNFRVGNRNSISTNSISQGFEFFDTILNKPIWWDGTDWVDSNGQTPGKHSGELADLPDFLSGTAGANDDGYQFTFTDDATYGDKIVWWNTNAGNNGAWVDANGTVVITNP